MKIGRHSELGMIVDNSKPLEHTTLQLKTLSVHWGGAGHEKAAPGLMDGVQGRGVSLWLEGPPYGDIALAGPGLGHF